MAPCRQGQEICESRWWLHVKQNILSQISLPIYTLWSKKTSSYYRPISQIPPCTSSIFHASPCNRNEHICAHWCTKMIIEYLTLRLMNCGIWNVGQLTTVVSRPVFNLECAFGLIDLLKIKMAQNCSGPSSQLTCQLGPNEVYAVLYVTHTPPCNVGDFGSKLDMIICWSGPSWQYHLAIRPQRNSNCFTHTCCTDCSAPLAVQAPLKEPLVLLFFDQLKKWMHAPIIAYNKNTRCMEKDTEGC